LAFFNGILTIIAYIITSLFLFTHPKFRIIIDMALPLYYIISTFILAFTLKAHHEFKKRKKIEKIFGNLVSQNVLKQLITKPHRLNLKSSVKKVTVMSCNIINNLQISEDITPEKYVQLLNNVFNAIENIIFKHNGTINRFIGNSVLVYWGYPIQSRKDALNAINTAKEISKKIDEFNASIANLNFDKYDERNFKITNPTEVSFNVKIAINSGEALIGQIGSSNVSDFTVMGECVDTVEKMVNICKEFDKTIVVSENTLELLDKEIPTTFSGQIRSKNSQNKIKLFELKLP
jgi:adenylate cyclase